MRKLIFVLLSALLVCCFCINALAVDGAIDLNRKGTLSVKMECSHGYRSGGIVALYPVAYTVWRDGNYHFDYTEDFADCGLPLNHISNNLEAGRFADYAKEAGIEPIRASLEGDGVADFYDLPLGLYMVVHEESTDGFTMALPFFVTVPVSDGENWDYEVDASPKVEIEHSGIEHPPGIPQTGQLKWPIPVLAFSGILVFAMGWFLFRRNDNQ